MLESIKRLSKEPLVHFLLIGAGIYVLYGIVANEESEDDGRTIVVSPDDRRVLIDQWTRVWNRPPTEQEFAGALEQHVRVQMLYREALAMGLDQGDTVVERRLAQKLEMLTRSLITPDDPGDEQLQRWYEENPDEFRRPDLYTMTHIYFDPDKRGASTSEDALALLKDLEGSGPSPDGLETMGDRFLLQQNYVRRTELDLQKLFGSEFAEAVIALEAGQWQGPIRSGYGAHLVHVSEVDRRSAPPFEQVRTQILDRWTAEQVDLLSERFIDELLSRYDVIIEEEADSAR